MKKILAATAFALVHFAAPAQKSALLWEISGNGLEKPSYLFGTIHLLCPKDFKLSDGVKARLADTRQLALELDFDDPKMMVAMQQTMGMSGEKTLKSVLSESDYALVANYFKDSLKMPLAPFAGSKPFVLTSLMYPRLLGCAPKSYELDFVQLAKKEKKEVIGLETVEEQMAVFDKIPYEKQAEQVVKLVKDPAKARKEFADLVQLYRSGNIKKMPRLANRDSGFEGFEGELLENRNRRWIPIIEREAREMPTFFAVGAAHLGGKTGVIRLLKKAGFTVRALE